MGKFLALMLCFLLAMPPAAQAQESSLDTQSQIAQVSADIEKAIERVVAIVNQPVAHIARDPAISVQIYSPGWFHPGANKPDFNHVDIRKTQELTYAPYPFVSSDLNPTEMFQGSQLEFNANTKYFYTDRTMPKKKLTEAEMLEINKLYRVIGEGEAKLAELKNPKPAPAAEATSFLKSPPALIAAVFFAALAFVFLSRKKPA